MKEKIYKELFELVRYLAKIEVTTTAGRVNILGMLLSLILTLCLSLPALLETVIRIIHPKAQVGTSLVQLLIAFSVFVLICAGMLAYLEGPRSRAGSAALNDAAPRSVDPPDSVAETSANPTEHDTAGAQPSAKQPSA